MYVCLSSSASDREAAAHGAEFNYYGDSEGPQTSEQNGEMFGLGGAIAVLRT